MRAFDTEEKDKAKSLLIIRTLMQNKHAQLRYDGVKGYNDLPTTIS